MAFTELLCQSAEIKARTTVSSYGSETVSFAIVVADYKCRLYNVSVRLVRLLSGEQTNVDCKAIGEINSNIVDGALFIIDAITYEVVGSRTVSSFSLPHHMEMFLARRYDL